MYKKYSHSWELLGLETCEALLFIYKTECMNSLYEIVN